MEAIVDEDDLAVDRAADATGAASITRRTPARKPFPAHLPRERVVIPTPTVCPCCGLTRLCKPSESITEMAERITTRWKIIQTVRNKVSCRDCETISQLPAPFHTTPRSWAGPNLLATLLFEKFGQHQPLNRQPNGTPTASIRIRVIHRMCTLDQARHDPQSLRNLRPSDTT